MVFRSRVRGQVTFLRAAHRGDDSRVGPPGELDRRVPNSTRATGHQNGPALQGARSETHRTVLGHRQAPVRSQERDAQARAHVVRRHVREEHHVPGRHDGVLLGRAAGRTLVRRLPDPHPEALQRRLDALTDRVDHAGPVLIGDLRRINRRTRLATSTRLPIGRVDAGAMDPDPHLSRSGLRHRPVDELQNLRVPGHRVLDRTHAPDATRNYPSRRGLGLSVVGLS